MINNQSDFSNLALTDAQMAELGVMRKKITPSLLGQINDHLSEWLTEQLEGVSQGAPNMMPVDFLVVEVLKALKYEE